MSQIKVDTNGILALSSQMKNASGTCKTCMDIVSSVKSSLDWQVRMAETINERMDRLNKLLKMQQHRMDHYSRALQTAEHEFQKTDKKIKQDVGALTYQMGQIDKIVGNLAGWPGGCICKPQSLLSLLTGGSVLAAGLFGTVQVPTALSSVELKKIFQTGAKKADKSESVLKTFLKKSDNPKCGKAVLRMAKGLDQAAKGHYISAFNNLVSGMEDFKNGYDGYYNEPEADILRDCCRLAGQEVGKLKGNQDLGEEIAIKFYDSLQSMGDAKGKVKILEKILY